MSDAVTLTGESRPWGGQVTGDCGPYTDGQWRDVWETLFDGSGDRGPLLNWSSELEVTERGAGANMSVDVAAGAAVIDGEWAQSTSTVNLTVAANASGLTRYDLVFAHWTAAGQVTQLRIVDGVPGAGACESITNYQTVGVEWAIPLACVEVANGAASIVDANITDLREFCRFRTDLGHLVDGATIDLDTNLQLYVPDGAIGINQIAAAIAGDGLSGGGGAALDVNAGDGLVLAADTLDVNVDAATITIVADVLQVGAIDNSHISNRTRTCWLGASQLHETNANAPTWDAIGAQPVAAEGWVLTTGNDRYAVGHWKAPADLVTGNVSVIVVWSHVAAANQVCRLEFTYIDAMDCDGDLTGGTTSITDDTNANLADADLRICTTLSSTIAMSAGQYLDFYVGRNGAHGNDTLAVSAVLLGVAFSYTADM